MTPSFGAGAGQAIDVRTIIHQTMRTYLGHLLAHPLTTLDNVPAAPKAYQDVLLPFAQSIARESERTRYMFEFNLPGSYDGTDRKNERDDMEILKEKILGQFGWEGEGDGARRRKETA